MSKTRIKVTGPTIRSRMEAEVCLGEIRSTTIARNAAMADRERERKAIDDNYGATLEGMNREIELRSEQLRGWAEANPNEFGGLKSLDLTHGLLGWRIGNPTLKCLTGWSWDRVLEKIKSVTDGLRFVRTKEEVDKQGLLAERANFTAEQLRELGLKVTQEEAFFVEPKLDEAEKRTVLA